jgi:eukaryotic-like serine/threonine-protein kinase
MTTFMGTHSAPDPGCLFAHREPSLWKALRVPPPRANAPLTLGGRYRVIERLGSGGMATVLLAEDERLGRLVAVKRLPTSSPEDALARFRREARLGASLNHPNVVSIFDSATDDDALLIVMEYVEGESLKDQLRRGPLAPERAMGILSQIGAALDHAHAAGVIHRDVKPSNVLIAGDGTAKLADLGIATAVDATSITTTNDIIGTLFYIAPERLEGAGDHPSADVYSLAAVAFEALSGQRAQRAQTAAEVVAVKGLPDLHEVWPAAPAAAAAVLREGLTRDPSRRPGSAGELVDRLSAALSGEETMPSTAAEATTKLPAQPRSALPPRSPIQPAGTSGRRGWSARRMGLAAAVAGLAGALIAVLTLGGSDDGRRTARVKTKTHTVTTKTAAPRSDHAPLTGAALGAQLNDQGYALIQEGSYEEAIPVLQRAVDAFPDGTTDINYAYALYNLGHALRLAGRPQEAIPILEQRLQFRDQTGVVSQELALAQEATGEVPSGGTAAPEDNGSSGGVKPGKGPKPGKGKESDEE